MYEEKTKDGAYDTLYDRFALTVFTYICQQVSNVQDAEDLLVEVFVAAFKNEGLSICASIGVVAASDEK